MDTLTILLSSHVKAELLRLLFGPVAQDLHVRELARQADLAVSTVRQELKRLARVGVVIARRDGNRTCWRANIAHPLHPDLRNLVLKTSGMVDVLREALQDLGVRAAFVFGSLAAGEGKPGSDVDLMVLGMVSLRELTKRLSPAASRLRLEINPHVMKAEEFARRRAANDHFLTTVLRAPKLFVIGDERELTRLGR